MFIDLYNAIKTGKAEDVNYEFHKNHGSVLVRGDYAR